jgi:hypothetical protein
MCKGAIAGLARSAKDLAAERIAHVLKAVDE